MLSRAAMVYNETTQPLALEYAIAAKVYCTQAYLEVTDTALQLFGGKGLTRDVRWKSSMLSEDGVNDVLALVEARRLLNN